MIKITFYSLLFVCVIGCYKDAIPTPTLPTKKLTFLDSIQVWQQIIQPDSSECSVGFVFSIGDKAIFVSHFYTDRSTLVHGRNADTGQKSWGLPSNSIIQSVSDAVLTDAQKLFVNSWGKTAIIDPYTGNIAWEYNVKENPNTGGNPRIGYFRNKLFQGIFSAESFPSVGHLLCTDDGSPQWDTLFTVRKIENNDFSPMFIEPVSGMILPNSDTVIVFSIGSWSLAQNRGKGDLIALNLTRDTLQWRIDDFDVDLSSEVLPIVNGKVYANSNAKVACVDVATGNVVWEAKDFSLGKLGSNMIAVGNRLYINTSEWDGLYCLDANTGAKLGKSSNYGNVGELKHYNGRIYFTSAGDGKLHCVNATTMREEWAHLPSNNRIDSRSSFAFAGIAIDTVRGYLYTSDHFFALCFKLPE